MMKLVKLVFGLIVALVALVLVLVLTLPLWLGPVAKPSANAAVPKLTKTTFNLGHLYLNPYTGRFELGDLQLGNPSVYSEKRALTLNKLVVDVAMGTLGDDYVHVEEVTIDGVFVSYLSANGVNNFEQIQYNVAGGKEKYEAKQAKAKAKAEAKAKADAEAKAKGDAEKGKARPEPEEEDIASKKLVIDRLVINDIKVCLGFMTLPVPSVTLTDLGKKSNGITLAELGDKIMEAILKGATAVGDGAKVLGGLIGSGTDKATKAVGEQAKTVGAGAGKAVDAVGKGAKTVGEGAGKAVDAVGEGAKKAADALKKLF